MRGTGRYACAGSGFRIYRSERGKRWLVWCAAGFSATADLKQPVDFPLPECPDCAVGGELGNQALDPFPDLECKVGRGSAGEGPDFINADHMAGICEDWGFGVAQGFIRSLAGTISSRRSRLACVSWLIESVLPISQP